MKKTALYLSHLLNPAMLALVIFGLQGLLNDWLVGGMGICAFSLMPGLVLLILVRLGYLDQVYPEDRNKRGILLLLGTLCYTLGWVGLYWLGATLLVLVSAATFVVSTLLVWWVNRYWKISIHAAGVGGAACILLVSFGGAAWPFLLSLPSIAWARLYLRVHTPAQIGVGAVLGAGSAVLLFMGFDLL